jgi:redox-sensitive bicupin YhaK (pirin superfamily)
MKQVTSQHDVQPENVGPMTIGRALPNAATKFVGPIMMLDHIPLKVVKPGEIPEPDGSFAHPHRGIATFSYVLEGALTHADSAGGHGTINAGGVQWMKAGNGIVHDEMIPADLRKNGGTLHSFQFWVNLPAKNKAEPAEYMPVPAEDLLLGTYDRNASPIPTYSSEFIWHLRIEPTGTARVELPKRGCPWQDFSPARAL